MAGLVKPPDLAGPQCRFSLALVLQFDRGQRILFRCGVATLILTESLFPRGKISDAERPRFLKSVPFTVESP